LLLSDLVSIKKHGIVSGPAGTRADAPAAAAAGPAGTPSPTAADRAFTIESGAYTIRFSLHTAAPAYAASADAPARDAGLLLDFDLLAAAQDGLAVRRRRAGDFMRPAGMNGTKRLQDLFVDAKLPREYRDAVPLIAAGKEILCILAAGRFARKTGNYAVTAATERVLRIVYAKRDDRRPGETEGESI
jgi:tRNA(Ile)-lysidine synthetase-like protein